MKETVQQLIKELEEKISLLEDQMKFSTNKASSNSIEQLLKYRTALKSLQDILGILK